MVLICHGLTKLNQNGAFARFFRKAREDLEAEMQGFEVRYGENFAEFCKI